MPDCAADKAELALCWFEASWTLVPDIVAIETANAEKMSTKIKDMMSTAPRRFSFSFLFLADAILIPPQENTLCQK